MKKFFDALAVPKEGKISDKTMTYNIIACVIGVLLCMASLAAATWAWYSGSVTSTANSIAAGEYSITVSVSDGSGELNPDDDGAYTLAAGVEYTVSLKGKGNVSTGYCVAQFGSDTTKYYSEQIFTEASAKSPNTVTFTVTSDTDTTVSLYASWGTYSGDERDIYSNGAYVYSESEFNPAN